MKDGELSAEEKLKLRPWRDYWEFRAAIEPELAPLRTLDEVHEQKVRPFHAPRKGLAYHRRIK